MGKEFSASNVRTAIGAKHDDEVVRYMVEVAPGRYLAGMAFGDELAIYSMDDTDDNSRYNKNIVNADKPLFEIKVLGPSVTRILEDNDLCRIRNLSVGCTDSYDASMDPYYDNRAYEFWNNSVYEPWYRRNYWGRTDEPRYANRHMPWHYVPIQVTVDGVMFTAEFRFLNPVRSVVDLSAIDAECPKYLPFVVDAFGHIDLHKVYIDSLATTARLLKTVEPLQYDVIWNAFLLDFNGKTLADVDTGQTKAVEGQKSVRANLERLAVENNLLFRFYLWLHDSKTQQGTSNNKLLAAMMKVFGTSSYDMLVYVLRHTLNIAHTLEVPSSYSKINLARNICLALPTSVESERQRKEKKEWNLRKDLAGQADGLGIDQTLYPLLHKAVTDGSIPVGVFHEPGDPLKLVNVEFGLWEKALNRDGWAEVLQSIARDAARRSTYTRKITPYIAFLFRMEQYMQTIAPSVELVQSVKNDTGVAYYKMNPWRCMPRYVESQWDLEMSEAAGEQTTKRRSAFTPVADNENRILTVPYAAMAISGRQTTYCYSEEYHVFEAFHFDEEGGGVVVNTLEEKLNGRDDYGLMYFTLTGTPRNQGYPTFLIIRENRKAGPFIHFHRVHPNRYKEGRPTPTCRLVQECYRYMTGNVRAEEITEQQGDLIFIKADRVGDAVNEPKLVDGYENHQFTAYELFKKKTKTVGHVAINMYQSTAKSVKNRLGYIEAPNGLTVRHPEHEWIRLEPGCYEIRRCKSWEANPISVWTLNID